MRFKNLRIREVDINRKKETLKIVFSVDFKKQTDKNKEVVLKGVNMLSPEKNIQVFIYDEREHLYQKVTQREKESVVSYVIQRNLKLFEMET